MNRENIIKSILLEYSLLSPNGGADRVDVDLLLQAIDNLGYQEYFSLDVLSESAEVINKMVPHLPESEKKEKSPKYLNSEEISIIYNILGGNTARRNFTDEELKSVDLNKIDLPTEFSTANEPIEPSSYSVMVAKLNASENSFKITYSETKLRIVGGDGKSLSVINIPKGLSIYDTRTGLPTTYFKQLLLWAKFYKEHKSKIKIEEAADPNEKTKISATSLKDYFDKNNPDKISFNLFVKNVSEVFNAKVKVDGAEYIAGVKKADIALTDRSKQNFWISFKASDYFTAEGSQVLAKVGLRHYGMVNSLSDQLSNNPTWKSLETKLLTGLRKNITGIEIDATKTTFDQKTGRLSVLNGKPLDQYGFTDEQISTLIHFNKAIQRMVTNTGVKKRYLYFSRPFSGYLEFLDTNSTSEMKEIAGKSIYGVDFKLDGSAPFGPENCSVVMFSGTQLMMEKHVTDTPDPALLIRTDGKGNVYPNPYLPLPKGEGDPILRYLPTFQIVTKSINDKHDFYIGDDQHLFLNLRIVITAKAKVPADAVDMGK